MKPPQNPKGQVEELLGCLTHEGAREGVETPYPFPIPCPTHILHLTTPELYP